MWIHPEIKLDSQKLIETCKKEKCIFIQIEYLDYDWIKNEKTISHFSEWYYKKFITPYTAIIDLQLNEDEILAKMKPKGRYNIKLAKKKWVTVEKVEKTNENIQKYFNLSVETTSRDNFSWHSFDYYRKFLDLLQQSELFLAYKDWKVIAGWIFVFDPDISYYYYWASTSKKEYRKLMAPYVLQWEAIKHAKSLWSQIYDFLWISWEGKEYDASLSWVTDFKMKLTPNSVKVSNSHIYVNKKLFFLLIMIIKKIKSRLK
jgi:lipid II:glycine glycyltransferase (peptidoglycan interpeptide bridge formation enzyme)